MHAGAVIRSGTRYLPTTRPFALNAERPATRKESMATTDRETVLELDRIVKTYRTKGSFFGGHGKEVVALNQLSFKIRKGEIFGLVGESGSGKTTAGRLIVRLAVCRWEEP